MSLKYKYEDTIRIMALPNRCSYSSQSTQCNIPPSYFISIHSSEEFLVGMSCEEHQLPIGEKIRLLQEKNLLPKGKIGIQNIKIVTTNCIKGTKEDYEEIFYKRLLDS
ncbi:MAG: hypothetical protein ACE5SW_00665 [Nitrososphaeraceae archaeon]